MQQYLARLESLAKIFRVFQAALLPPLPAPAAPHRFAAVTAASDHPLLPCALMECAEHVLSALDAAPDFCLLQTRAPGERPELAPQLARTFLRGGRWGLQPAPVLIGSTDRALDAAVVLTAATLPGARLLLVPPPTPLPPQAGGLQSSSRHGASRHGSVPVPRGVRSAAGAGGRRLARAGAAAGRRPGAGRRAAFHS